MAQFDAIVVGAGQAGPPLAGRMSAAGQTVAVIERKLVGGTCVNSGCIPTKTLVASAHSAHTARRGPLSIVLTNKEFALLEHLMLNRGQCVSRVELLESVWNFEPAQTTNIVDVYINYLRNKIDDGFSPKLIHTVRGVGYELRCPVEGAA